LVPLDGKISVKGVNVRKPNVKTELLEQLYCVLRQ